MMRNNILTPHDVEQRLIQLSARLEEATNSLIEREHAYAQENYAYERALAESRITLSEQKMTVPEKEARAAIVCDEERLRRDFAEAQLKAAKAILKQIYTDIEVWRSIGSSVRAAVDIS